MAGNPAPGWYPDPEHPDLMRWWDGARWSGETRSAAAAFPAEAGPAPFGTIKNPDSAVTGDQSATWREPALQAWAEAYRAAGPAAEQETFPVRAWLIGGAAAVVIAGVVAWFLIGLLGR